MNPIHIYRTILSAAGEQAPVLKRCLRDSVIASRPACKVRASPCSSPSAWRSAWATTALPSSGCSP